MVSPLFRGGYAGVLTSGSYTSRVPPASSSPPASSNAQDDWPGRRLGLPPTGPRSVARIGRRIAALCIDWAIAYGLSYAFFRLPDGSTNGFVTSGIFAVMQAVLVAFAAGGIGHLVLGMRVVAMNGRWVGVLRPAARAVLLTLVIPAVIFDADQRGLHDRLSGTLLVRR